MKDSILLVINTTQLDTVKMIGYEQLAANYRRSNEDSAFHFNQKAIDVAKDIKEKRFLAEAYREYALTAQAVGKYPTATTYYQKSLEIHEKSKNKDGMANAYNDIGISYYYAGDYGNAREYFERAGKIRLEIGDSIGSGQAFNNTGIMYDIEGKPDKAVELYIRALNIYESAKDTNLIIGTISNIGLIYVGQKNYKDALKIYHRQKRLAKKIRHNRHYGVALSSIGTVYDHQKNYLEARKNFFEALTIYEQLGDKALIAQCYNNLSVNHELTDEDEQALSYALKAIDIKKEIGAYGKLAVSQIAAAKAYSKLNQPHQSISLYQEALKNATNTNYYDHLIKSHQGLAEAYGKIGRYKEAYHHQAKFIVLNDSLLNEENTKIVNELEKKYENDKKQKEIELLNKDNLLKDVTIAKTGEENKRKSMQLYLAIIGVIALLILALLIFRNNQQKKKSNLLLVQKNDEISQQKLIVEEKNREITDSIQYAKRIQSAILPPDKVVKEYLQESFILYKPKDIVAGDFYWMESVTSTRHSGLDQESPNNSEIADQSGNDTIVLFAAADCTGHGVPGAMVSVVCNNALNRSVREHGLTDPGEILNKTREIVIEEFEKSDEEVKDGMDIALCTLKGNKLMYAGAHNPLWLIRQGEIIEIKANKQPIGKFDNPLPYTTHTFELQKGDTIYIFSDGYVDQFGGEKGKKFKAKAFKELLLSIQDQSMSEQKITIDQSFEKWKGNLEQIDDVCVIGVKI